tara:strand:- start:1185 stop:1943 length:759 start_codon:yes stop_codon:yes gene_type:complete
MTNKLIYFVANWKMFGSIASISIIKKIGHFLIAFRRLKKIKIVFCLPYTLIYLFSQKNRASNISIGAQNCHQSQNYGALTGRINASMIKNAGAKYIILGHSENRSDGDSNKIIKEKIFSSLNEKLNVIFCIGETLSEKKNKKTFNVLRKQINSSLKKKMNFNKIIIAYEPIWSIGTGRTLNSKDLIRIFKFISRHMKKNFKIKKSPILLYGGSVNQRNIKLFSNIPMIDGFLIGGSSQSSKKLIDIIKNYYK